MPIFIFGILTFAETRIDAQGGLQDGERRWFNQSWYEGGSAVSTAALLIVLNYSTDAMKAANPAPLINRHFFGRKACSQVKLTELWSPIIFHTGVNYALVIKSVSLGLIYGPLWPCAYLLTAIGLALSYFCTRAGLRHWYRMPANVQGDMMLIMRWRLGNVAALAVLCQILATHDASA